MNNPDSYNSNKSKSKQAEEAAESAAAYAKTGDQPERSFAELGVPGPLVSVLARDGKTVAFPIQADTLGDSLAGRDVLGRGETGSGKTLAFAIPLVTRLGEQGEGEAAMRDFERMDRGDRKAQKRAMLPHPHGMILAPTRELVNQINEVVAPLAAAYDMQTATIYGGVKYSRQISELKAGAEIIVACPGRLEDLLRQGALSIEDVEVAVLDEADEMADMGFLPSVQRLLEQVDPNGQRMLFSATLDHGVDKVVKQFLHDPKIHEIAPADAQVDTMTHHVFEVSQGNKYEVIRELASGKGKRILFTRTKYQAKKMADKLVKEGIPAVDLQGNLSQNQRDRHLAAFTSGDVNVLVATDVAARGIDVSDVAMVVQTEPPEDPKSFLHRSGRTARAGESGDVVTLVLPQQRRDARQMLHRAGIKAKSQQIVPGAPELEELVGEHAPLVEGWTLTVPVVNRRAGRTGRGGRNEGRGGRGYGRKDRGGRRDRNNRHGDSGRSFNKRGRDDSFEDAGGRGGRDGGFNDSRDFNDSRSHGGRRDGHKNRNPRYDDGQGPIDGRSSRGRRDDRRSHKFYDDDYRKGSGKRSRHSDFDERGQHGGKSKNRHYEGKRSGGRNGGYSEGYGDSYGSGKSNRHGGYGKSGGRGRGRDEGYEGRSGGHGRDGSRDRNDGYQGRSGNRNQRSRKADGFHRSHGKRNSTPFRRSR
ncbi:DEAD/DEAH box helicase [Bifidobacterium sp. ESL0728]|uniref:DEAD/DEAH box helicase n=1 Tax=Bifidobacterium sp. ESL0728 TaxID=2983220 RepID=UPI0023F8C4D3|nr:DEAD/DEAH box helicase [Bifidobacterium sp. ESL0728]WEV59531.1 DEAD/DEAH box helicase [Bifidobacterium sp. ESL0728]